MSAVLIVNPYASRVAEGALAAVARELGPVEVIRTEGRGHATELAREAAGKAEAVYVFSGDGGFNEVLNGIDGDTPVGFVPGGGTNVLPRALGLPRDPVLAARRLRAGRTRRISLGRANGRLFGFSAGLGLDAELIRRLDALGRRRDGKRPGDVAFMLTTLRVLAERRARIEPTLHLEGFGRAAFALVANCDPYSYAGRLPLRVAPEARFELGLDVVAPRALRPWIVPQLVAHLLLGRGQASASNILYGHDLNAIAARCDVPMPLQVDGEDLGDVTEVVFCAERSAVTILA